MKRPAPRGGTTSAWEPSGHFEVTRIVGGGPATAPSEPEGFLGPRSDEGPELSRHGVSVGAVPVDVESIARKVLRVGIPRATGCNVASLLLRASTARSNDDRVPGIARRCDELDSSPSSPRSKRANRRKAWIRG